MRPLLSPEEMGRADAATISGGTPGFVLMERAGRAVARAAVRLAGGRYGRRAAVVCGKGNNGGDGFVAARALYRQGLSVSCLALAERAEFRGDAATHLEAMERAGVRLRAFDAALLDRADVVVDAIFGTGFRGTAEGAPGGAIEAVNSCGAPVVAVDIPSGVDGTTGTVEGPAVRANVTVAMAAEKFGTAITPGAEYAGVVEVADIGIAVEGARVHVPSDEDAAARLPRRPLDSHKRSVGAVVLLAGSEGMSGAALLSARGAARAGAGYVTLISTPYVDDAKRRLLPEVVSRVGEGAHLGPKVLDEFADDIERADALAVGPGLSTASEPAALVERVLTETEVPVVLDADGLNVLAGHADALGRAAPTVITPHPAEMARLLGITTEEVQADRLRVGRAAAEELGCVVVLKGSRSVIAEPGGAAIVNPTGGPQLATAGTGDVLTGVVAALLAAGLESFEAAWTAVYVHGIAGAIAGRTAAGQGVLAWDVAEALPHAIAAVLPA